jgi:chromosome segregation ATPase
MGAAIRQMPTAPMRPMATMRPSAGGAVSLPAIGGGMVAAEIASEISSLQSNISFAQSKASLTDVRSEMSQLDQQLSKLSQTLEGVRKQGYVYGGDVDPKLYDLMSQWQSVRPQAEEAISQHAYSLSQSAANLHGPLSQLARYTNNAAQARSLMPSASASVQGLIDAAQNAESSIEAMYSNIRSEASAIETQLRPIEAMMALMAGARFKLAEGESAVMAVKAKLDKEGKDEDMQGYLYLTDKRLLYERKEEIVKKKVLFIATDKELVHELVMETSLANVAGVKASKKGLMGNEDHLDVGFGGQAVHFHLDGQDSREWQALIERAKSGGLESERAAAGAGISMADMTGPVTQADILQLQSEFNDLQGRAMLTFAKDALEDMENKVSNLPRQLSDARAKGYVFEKALDSQTQSLVDQWARVKETVENDMRQQTAALSQLMPSIQKDMAILMAHSGDMQSVRPQYMGVKSLIASTEAQVAAAEGAVFGQYDDFQAEVDTLSAHLDWVDWMLQALSTASFQLMATEGGVAASQANWLRPNSDPLGGILFLSDQRLIFEEREGEFSVPLEAPASLIASATPLSAQGANQDEEHLDLSFASGAPMSSTKFQLLGPQAEAWQAMIGRAKAGDYTKDRAVEIDQAEVDKVKNAPTECPSCGSKFTAPVLRGQTEIRCESCGTVTRL